MQERESPALSRHGLFAAVCAGAALALAPAAFAAGAVPFPTASERPPASPSFARDVAPMLARWCGGCHGARKAHRNLRFDSYDGVLRGGDSGPAVVAGDPAASPLVARIDRSERPAMPPRKRLPKPDVTVVRAWIAAGAQNN